MLRSPMCDYLISFIGKLRQLPETAMMNSVLENFTVLQVRVGGAVVQRVERWTCNQ